MSLARRPSGLPSNPRARPSLDGQNRPDPIPRPRSAASERPPPSSYHRTAVPPLPQQPRVLRPQRSQGNLPSRPTGSVRARSLDRRAEPRQARPQEDLPPPLPRIPTLPKGGRVGIAQNRGYGNVPTHSTARSVDYNAVRGRGRAPVEDAFSDSASSSGGSDMFVKSPTSGASSRTSLDETDMYEKMGEKPAEGFGSSLWTSIAGVASNLSINVGKALSTNVSAFSGEETPVGGESRLTRALKAYHIEQARDPADLPDWLFDERERGVRSHQASASVSEPARATRPSDLSRSVTTARRDDPPQAPQPRVVRGPTLADRKATSGTGTSSRSDSGPGSDAHVTKSISRLRELRDAKRNAKVRFGGGRDEPVEEEEEVVIEPQRKYSPQPPAPSAPTRYEPVSERVPPPTRPRGNMPAPLGASLGGRGRQPMGLPTGVRPARA